MSKVMIINGSPRKNFNTAKMLKEAGMGAQDAGAEGMIGILCGIGMLDK